MDIDRVDQLRTLYPMPKERALRKQLTALDVHCRRFIGLSPFVVVASTDRSGGMDPMIADQVGATGPVESQEEMLARYAADL